MLIFEALLLLWSSPLLSAASARMFGSDPRMQQKTDLLLQCLLD